SRSSGGAGGRITSACRVVSLMYGSTATMNSSDPNASSSRRPSGVDSTGFPATVTIARRQDLFGHRRHRQLAAELRQAADAALPGADVPAPESEQRVHRRPRE